MVLRLLNVKVLAALALLVAAAVAGFWWLQQHDFNVRAAIEGGLALLRTAGPWVFFMALAVLPAFGFPVSVFYLAAGPAFAGTMGMGGVLLAAAAALAANLALTYWLARYGMRPTLEAMIARTKYRIPVVPSDEQAELALLVRITPGPPFFIQSYLLGLAGVRFGLYMGISWVVAFAYGSGFMVFGDALLQGKGRMIFFGASVLVAVVLAVHLLRRHFGKKKNT